MWELDRILGREITLRVGREFKGTFTQTVDDDNGEQGKTCGFSLWFLDYNLESGLFVAKANDKFGNSSIVGALRPGEMKFDKYYGRYQRTQGGATLTPRDCTLFPPNSRGMYEDYYNFRVFMYEGEFRDPGRFSGHYFSRTIREPLGNWTFDILAKS